jgi:hypothetical protein
MPDTDACDATQRSFSEKARKGAAQARTHRVRLLLICRQRLQLPHVLAHVALALRHLVAHAARSVTRAVSALWRRDSVAAPRAHRCSS